MVPVLDDTPTVIAVGDLVVIDAPGLAGTLTPEVALVLSDLLAVEAAKAIGNRSRPGSPMRL